MTYSVLVKRGGKLFNISIDNFADENDFMPKFLKWLRTQGYAVKGVTVPTFCDTCNGWTMMKESVYSPRFHPRRGRG